MRSGTSSIASAPPTDSTTSSSPSAPWPLISVMLVSASAATAAPRAWPSLGCEAAALSAVSAASVAWLSASCGSSLVGTGSDALVDSSWASSIGGSLSAAAAGASSAGSSAIGSAAMATGDPASGERSSVASASGAMCSDAAAMASPSVPIGALLVSSRAFSLARSAPACPPPGSAVGLGLGGALRALVLGDQRLSVGDWDLVIVGMDFAEGQEAVAIAAVVDEGGLQRRLDARHLGQINVAAKLLTACGLEVEFLDTMAAQNNHPGLLRMGRIDEHFV